MSGEDDVDSGQFWLWKQYSFDTIPLEFISSIYEEFVTRDDEEEKESKSRTKPKSKSVKRETGVVFTRGMLADYVLDQVLPWRGTKWDLSVLDPSCGSGIFLVKAFQRLAHRRRLADEDEHLQPDQLSWMLEHNLFGVDINHHAIRVASFSLYLAMLDELDPKDYLERVRFPTLRNRRLVLSDFFKTDWNSREQCFDLIVGNAPWGNQTATQPAKDWAKKNAWVLANKNLGTLFLPACEQLLNKSGRLAMLQPAMALLFSRSDPALKFREKFFTSCQVEKVVNFSPVRFILFGGEEKAISPVCLVVIRSGQEELEEGEFDDSGLEYTTVKPSLTAEDEVRLHIDSFDIHWISRHEAAQDPHVWTCLSWGGRRDLMLLRALEEYPNLATAQQCGDIIAAKGLKWFEREADKHAWLEGWHIADQAKELATKIEVCAEDLPINRRVLSERPRFPKLFGTPQILIPQSWKSEQSRYRAIKINPDRKNRGALCTQSYLSVVGLTEQGNKGIESAWIIFNSKIAVYHQLLTSGRMASYRPESLVKELKLVPLPRFDESLVSAIKTPEDCDLAVKQTLNLKSAEQVLVEDLFDFTLPDFKHPANSRTLSPGRKPTERGSESTLRSYVEYFTKVIQATFGKQQRVSCTVWQETTAPLLGFRLIRLVLTEGGNSDFQIHQDEVGVLLDQTDAHFRNWQAAHDEPIAVSPVMRFYGSVTHQGSKAAAIWMIKPDQIRYWTRSMAMRDADEVALDIFAGGTPT